MTSDEKKELLHRMKQALIDSLRSTEKLTERIKPIGLDSAMGRISRMDYFNNQSIEEAGLRKAKRDIRVLADWIEKSDSKEFARCRMCGKEIAFGRLDVLPSTTQCIQCASQMGMRLFISAMMRKAWNGFIAIGTD